MTIMDEMVDLPVARLLSSLLSCHVKISSWKPVSPMVVERNPRSAEVPKEAVVNPHPGAE